MRSGAGGQDRWGRASVQVGDHPGWGVRLDAGVQARSGVLARVLRPDWMLKFLLLCPSARVPRNSQPCARLLTTMKRKILVMKLNRFAPRMFPISRCHGLMEVWVEGMSKMAPAD